MARRGRYYVPDQPFHVIQRGINRAPVFFAEADYRFYLEALGEAASRHHCAIHAYVLMTNHVHLLVTPHRADSIPRTLQSLGRRYVGSVNRRRQRTGTLWEGRYKATVIDGEAHLLTCYRYIELNPVRAGMVAEAADYRWSSHRWHAAGEADQVITDHPLYVALGASAGARQAAYRGLFGAPLAAPVIDQLRQATNGGWAFGDDRFKARVAEAAGRRAAPRPKGRPPKRAPAKRRPGP